MPRPVNLMHPVQKYYCREYVFVPHLKLLTDQVVLEVLLVLPLTVFIFCLILSYKSTVGHVQRQEQCISGFLVL